MQVKSTIGEILDLGSMLGGGGEALGVFHVIHDATLCAKIYKDNQKASRLEKKIEAMIGIYKAIRQNKGEAEQFFDKYLAWPRLKLYEPKTEEFVGFVMNKLPLCAGLDAFFNNDMRDEKSWSNRLDIATNLLKILKFLHDNRIVVGDLHKGNIFVLSHNEVALVDCDSFQIGNKFRFSALQPEIAPPEAKYVEFLEPVADVFSAGTLIYRLFMDGFNPFQFIRNGSLNPDLEQSKASGFAPIRDPKLELPPKSPPLERLPDKTRNVMANALDPDPKKRPSLDELIGAVEEVKKNVKVPLIISKQLVHASSPIPVIDFPRTPKLKINRTTFDFSKIRKGATVSNSFTISNIGCGLLTGRIIANNTWLKTSRSDIDVTRSKQAIGFSIDTSDLRPGFKDTGTITVQSNGGTETIYVNLAIKAGVLVLPIVTGLMAIGLFVAYYQRGIFKSVQSIPKQISYEKADAPQDEVSQDEVEIPPVTKPEEILPKEARREKAEIPVENHMKLSGKMRKESYLSWQKPSNYKGKTDKRSVVTLAKIERVDSVLRVKYGRGYAGTIDCKWFADQATYIGTWCDKGGSGKIQLTPLFDTEGTIVSFVGYQRDGEDSPNMMTWITSHRP